MANSPGRQATQAVESSFFCARPTWHWVQTERPEVAAKVPDRHLPHSVAAVAPENMPRVQLRQAVVADTFWKRPDGHATHSARTRETRSEHSSGWKNPTHGCGRRS